MLEIFKDVRGVQVFMSEKSDGNMKLFAFDFELNRKKYFEKNNLDYGKLVSAKLEHGDNIVIVKDCEENFIDYTDGLLTDNLEIILSVTSADCLPIFLFDPVQKVVGILHCGWRSVAKGIIEKSIKMMQNNFASQSKDILIGIGPGIQKCHFEVEEDLLEDFENYEKFVINKNGKKYFDLKEVVRQKFIAKGIKNENIEIDSRCSYCEKNLWSYRLDGDGPEGVRAGIAGIKLV